MKYSDNTKTYKHTFYQKRHIFAYAWFSWCNSLQDLFMFFEASCSGDVWEAPQYLLSISSKVSSSWPETALIFNFSLMISSSSSSILRWMVCNGIEVEQYLFCDIFFALLHITIDEEVIPVVQLADVHLCILRSWIRLFQTNVQLLDLVLYNHYVVKTFIGFKQLFGQFYILGFDGRRSNPNM